MAASNPRGPNGVPLPKSPPTSKSVSSAKKEKGKAKEQAGSGQKRRVGIQANTTATTTVDIEQDDQTWDWISLTEDTPTRTPPVFNKDGSYFFMISGPSVKIHATSSGEVVSVLTPPNVPDAPAADVLTSIVVNPQNTFQLITASGSGSVRIWDFLDGILLKTLELAQPILRLCAHDKFQDYVFVAVSRPSKKKNGEENAAILKVSLHTAHASDSQSSKLRPSEITPIGKTRCPTGLSCSPSGSHVVVTAGHKVYAARTDSLKAGFTKYVSPEHLTCLAFHPTDEYFATGDQSGVIRLWYCLNEQLAVKAIGVEKKTQTSSFHWHSHAVSALAFTSNGAYMLSGGEEAVLVVWQLESGKKEFVPRVGAPINTISVCRKTDGEECLLGLTDATNLFLDTTSLKLSRSFSRVKLDPSSASGPRIQHVPLGIHGRSSTLLLPSSHPSSLQIYSPSSSKLVSELEVSPSNRVSRRDDKALEPSRIVRVAVSAAGDWMATVDARSGDGSFRGEVYLKVWQWDKKSAFWILNTRVEKPHGLQIVTDLSFSPNSDSLVSIGLDSTVKYWKLRHTEGPQDGFWILRSTISIPSEQPLTTCWSSDASLLVVSTRERVSLYNPITNTHIRSLSTPECPDVQSAVFVGRGGRYLAVTGARTVVLWDLVLQSVRWCYTSPHPIRFSIPDAKRPQLILFMGPSEHTKVYFLSIASSKPMRSLTLPFGLRNIQSYSSSSPMFVGITTDWRVVLIGDDVKSAQKENAASAISQWATPRRSLFQDIFGDSAFVEVDKAQAVAEPWRADMPLKHRSDLFSQPAYLAPSLDDLFTPLLEGLVRRIKADDINIPNHNAVASVDAPMDVDVDDDPVPDKLSQRTSIVDSKQLDALIKVFKLHSVNVPIVTAKPVNIPNGLSNGHKSNGSTPKPVKKVAAPTTPVVLEIPSPITNGKKRKKSLG